MDIDNNNIEKLIEIKGAEEKQKETDPVINLIKKKLKEQKIRKKK